MYEIYEWECECYQWLNAYLRSIRYTRLYKMIEGIFRLTFPLSYPILIFGLSIAVCISILFFGSISCITFILLIQSGVLRLKPITDLLHVICVHLWPDLPDRIIANLRKSFPVNVTGTLPEKGIYLFHPHGLLSMAHMTNVGLKSISNWPVKAIRGTNLYSLWYSFGISEMSDGAFVQANYPNMKTVLNENMSLAVSLGGIEEMKYLYKDKILLKLKSRKGVFRLAIETGTPLVPVLAYGENELCDNVGNWRGFTYINKLLYSICHMHLIIPSWELYNKFLFIHKKPFDTPITSVIGDPVLVGKAREATEEDIRVIRNIYIQRLRELYKKTRPPHYAEELEII